MKKIKLNGKLDLNKLTVSRLNAEETTQVQGGETGAICTSYGDCTTNPAYYCCYPATSRGNLCHEDELSK